MPGIFCQLQCSPYNNVAFLHGSEIPYDIEGLDDK